MATVSDDDYFPKETPVDVQQPVPEETTGKKKKHSTRDGPRYTVGLQDVKDKTCYKDFFETEKLIDAKEKAIEGMNKHKRATIVWDRTGAGIIHRETPPEQVVQEQPPSIKKKKGKS